MITPATETFDSVLQRAIESSHTGATEQALALFEKAATLNPQSGLPHLLKGAELAQAGRIPEAEASFATAVLLAPQLPIARYQLGLLQFSSGRAALGLLTWQPLQDLPELDPLRLCVEGFSELARDRFDAALDRFRLALSRNQQNQPLNHDIRLMIDRIENRQSPISEAPQAATTQQDSTGWSELLLSTYRASGWVQ